MAALATRRIEHAAPQEEVRIKPEQGKHPILWVADPPVAVDLMLRTIMGLTADMVGRKIVSCSFEVSELRWLLDPLNGECLNRVSCIVISMSSDYHRDAEHIVGLIQEKFPSSPIILVVPDVACIDHLIRPEGTTVVVSPRLEEIDEPLYVTFFKALQPFFPEGLQLFEVYSKVIGDLRKPI